MEIIVLCYLKPLLSKVKVEGRGVTRSGVKFRAGWKMNKIFTLLAGICQAVGFLMHQHTYGISIQVFPTGLKCYCSFLAHFLDLHLLLKLKRSFTRLHTYSYVILYCIYGLDPKGKLTHFICRKYCLNSGSEAICLHCRLNGAAS